MASAPVGLESRQARFMHWRAEVAIASETLGRAPVGPLLVVEIAQDWGLVQLELA